MRTIDLAFLLQELSGRLVHESLVIYLLLVADLGRILVLPCSRLQVVDDRHRKCLVLVEISTLV